MSMGSYAVRDLHVSASDRDCVRHVWNKLDKRKRRMPAHSLVRKDIYRDALAAHSQSVERRTMESSVHLRRYVRLSRRLRSLYRRSAKAMRQETVDLYEREIEELESILASIPLTEREHDSARAELGAWS